MLLAITLVDFLIRASQLWILASIAYFVWLHNKREPGDFQSFPVFLVLGMIVGSLPFLLLVIASKLFGFELDGGFSTTF